MARAKCEHGVIAPFMTEAEQGWRCTGCKTRFYPEQTLEQVVTDSAGASEAHAGITADVASDILFRVLQRVYGQVPEPEEEADHPHAYGSDGNCIIPDCDASLTDFSPFLGGGSE